MRPRTYSLCPPSRIRKVKCDEAKPSCQKCVSTGRACDGYDSPFRLVSARPSRGSVYAAAGSAGIRSDIAGSRPGPSRPEFVTPPSATEITLQDIDLLNRYFSTKTIFDVNIGCEDAAKQILRASLTDEPIRLAVSSLRALREHLEITGDIVASEDTVSTLQQQPPDSGYDYGLQQYCAALKGLASNLASPLGSKGLKSALLCCQIFISIEQVRWNFTAMAQHIIQGLAIQHEYRARPSIVTADPNKFVPANHDQLPLLDAFVIKFFAAPCKFADAAVQSALPNNFRTIVPDMRTELVRISSLTLEFLDNLSQIKSTRAAVQLLPEKASLLDSLESWLSEVDAQHADTDLLSVAFLRLFHRVLRVVLLGALDSASDSELEIENGRLQAVADDIHERVKSYRTAWSGAKSSPGSSTGRFRT